MAYNPFMIFRYLPLSVLQALAGMVAWLIMHMPNVSINRSVRTNLLLAYPHLSADQRQQLHRRLIRNQCLTSVESVKCWAMPPDWSIAQIREVHNAHLLTEALAHPNGMLAIVPHLGTWEMMNAWLNQYGSPTILYKPVKGKISNDFVLQGRQRLNASLVPTDASGVKAIFKTLKAGGFSIILPDHVPELSGGVVVPFFGIQTLTSTLASKLASKTGCRLIGLACIRREDGRGFDIHCHAIDDPDLYSRDMIAAATALNTAMQQMIAPVAEHYMWGYRRFKHVPEIGNAYNLSDQQLQQWHSNLKKQ